MSPIKVLDLTGLRRSNISIFIWLNLILPSYSFLVIPWESQRFSIDSRMRDRERECIRFSVQPAENNGILCLIQLPLYWSMKMKLCQVENIKVNISKRITRKISTPLPLFLYKIIVSVYDLWLSPLPKKEEKEKEKDRYSLIPLSSGPQ